MKGMFKLPVINALILLLVVVYLVIDGVTSTEKSKEVYATTSELFNQFDYQKELNLILQENKEEKVGELEKIRKELLILEQSINGADSTEQDVNPFHKEYDEFQEIERSIEENLKDLNDLCVNQIWEKLNVFVNEYARENNYNIVLGSEEDDIVKQTKEHQNITKELVAFCNFRYNKN